MFRSFEEMPAWRKGMVLAQQIYQLTETLPRKEDYGFTSQIRRSSLSVTGNIAEGFGRKHTKDKLNFYYATRGSLAETRSHLLYGRKVGYVTQTDFSILNDLIAEIWRELNSLIKALHRRTQPQP